MLAGLGEILFIFNNTGGLTHSRVWRTAADPVFQLGNLRLRRGVLARWRHWVAEIFHTADYETLAGIAWYDRFA